ncbi:MAG: hypothetical protein NDI87_14195 [Rhodoferax sp.]|nr:hypothetical protein [Rhodoferax sp.]
MIANKSFADWGDVFPNAAFKVSLINRLVHHSAMTPLKIRHEQLMIGNGMGSP